MSFIIIRSVVWLDQTFCHDQTGKHSPSIAVESLRPGRDGQQAQGKSGQLSDRERETPQNPHKHTNR